MLPSRPSKGCFSLSLPLTCELGVHGALYPASLLGRGHSSRQVAQLKDIGRNGVRARHKESVNALPVPPQLLICQRPLRRLLQPWRATSKCDTFTLMPWLSWNTLMPPAGMPCNPKGQFTCLTSSLHSWNRTAAEMHKSSE